MILSQFVVHLKILSISDSPQVCCLRPPCPRPPFHHRQPHLLTHHRHTLHHLYHCQHRHPTLITSTLSTHPQGPVTWAHRMSSSHRHRHQSSTWCAAMVATSSTAYKTSLSATLAATPTSLRWSTQPHLQTSLRASQKLSSTEDHSGSRIRKVWGLYILIQMLLLPLWLF